MCWPSLLLLFLWCRMRQQMNLRCARAARGKRKSSSIIWPRELWWRSTKRAGHRCHANLTSSPRNWLTSSSDTPINAASVEERGDDDCGNKQCRCSVLESYASACSSRRYVYTYIGRSCWIGWGRQKRRMKSHSVAVSNTLSFFFSASPNFA